MMKRLIFRHLAFVGPDKHNTVITFDDGTNVIYGASNTGKSFTLAALQFMLGKSTPLPAIEQLDGYEAALLGIEVAGQKDFTLYRSVQGGGLRLYEGLHSTVPKGAPSALLSAEHDIRKENLSTMLLGLLDMDDKVVVKNENGEKASFTLRSLDPFVFVDEGSIIDARSPILSGQYTSATTEKNIFRLLLSGRDDSAVVAVVPPKIRKARQEGQKELLEQWVAELDAEIDRFGATREQLADQGTRLNASFANIQDDINQRQGRIDRITLERRGAVDKADRLAAQSREIELTLVRFARLMEVYDSDVERLKALSQGGVLLMTRLGQPCPLCGAIAEHQLHHGKRDVERSRAAAAAEILRINRERQDLFTTMNALEQDSANRREDVAAARKQIAAADQSLMSLRPEEANLREQYEARIEARDLWRAKTKTFEDRDGLLVQLSQISSTGTAAKLNLSVGIDGPTAHEFAQKVSEVLKAWHFPSDPVVTFHNDSQDVRLNGKDRGANGKGVRAVLHSAFKVATLLYCQDKNLPHPGVLVLDTPLLTYREPFRVPRHGELAADERSLAATPLYEHFYRHLASLKGRAQFMILENSDPPTDLSALMTVYTFTGDSVGERNGLFPPSKFPPDGSASTIET